MPWTYEIFPRERLIRCTLRREVSVEECLALLEAVRADRGYDPSFNCLVDDRELVGGFRREELERVLPAVMRIFATVPGRPRIAVVVGGDLQFGVTRMFQAISDGVENLDLRVFRDLGEAEAWVSGGA